MQAGTTESFKEKEMTVQFKGAFYLIVLALLTIWMITGMSRNLEKAKALEAAKATQPAVRQVTL